MSDPNGEVPTATAVPPRLLREPLGPSRRPCTCWRAGVTSLSPSREKWSLTRSALAPNPPGAVLKRHRSDVDRNTFIGIVSPFKRRLRGGVALAATGRRGRLAGRLFDLPITCTGESHTGPALQTEPDIEGGE